MPAGLERIVKRLISEGKSKSEAYALANYIYDKNQERKKRGKKKRR